MNREERGRIAILGYGFVCSAGDSENELHSSYTLAKAPCSLTENGIAFGIHKNAEQKLEESALTIHDGNRLDRTVKLAIHATANCLKTITEKITGNILVNIGSSRGATQTWENEFTRFLETGECSPKTSPYTTPGNISSHVAKLIFGKSMVIDHSVTCGSGSQAVANAAAWIRSGMADGALAGGAEAPLTPFTLTQMARLKITGENRGEAFPIKPLSSEKPATGMALGEGAAVFALGSEKKYPDADFFISGIGISNEQSQSPSGISDDGIALYGAMKQALDEAGISSPDVIIPHAPGTRKGDEAEWKAIQKLFTKTPRLYSNKHLFGHTLGASGTLSMVVACDILKRGIIPDMPYPAIGQETIPGQIIHVMINATGFGGNAISILISKKQG
jgi:3-oxoacyl-(acyl-carrier-protein) synthase